MRITSSCHQAIRLVTIEPPDITGRLAEVQLFVLFLLQIYLLQRI